MIPKLLDNTKTLTALLNDTTEGLGRLATCTSAKVTEERNGAFTLQFTLPITDRHYSEIAQDAIILAKPNPYDPNQMFRVYKSSKPMSGMVTFYCRHISYDLTKTSVMPFSATSATAACQGNYTAHDRRSVFHAYDKQVNAKGLQKFSASECSCSDGRTGRISA